MPVDPTKRDQFLEWVVTPGKKGGRAQGIHHAGTALAEAPLRIPFISPTMTWATSGGMPVGHMGRWYGPEGSGKSMNDWGLFYCAQNYPRIMTEMMEPEIKFWEKRKRMKALVLKKRLKEAVTRFPDGMSVALFDTEQRAQLDLAARMGVNLKKEKFVLIEETIIEEVIRQMAAAVEAYHIVAVDSASNAESFAEANLQPGEYERGTAAAAWKRLRRVRRRLDRQENTIIIVDQMRMQLGEKQYGGPKAKPPQNRFLKHNASLAVEFDEGKRLYIDNNGNLTDDRDKANDAYTQLGSDWKEVAGLEMRAQVAKNSTGKPFRNAVMRFKFPMADSRTGELIQDVGFDTNYELMVIAEHFHIIESGGGGMFYLLDEKFKRVGKPYQWKGEPKVTQAIIDDEGLAERIQTRLRLAT